MITERKLVRKYRPGILTISDTTVRTLLELGYDEALYRADERVEKVVLEETDEIKEGYFAYFGTAEFYSGCWFIVYYRITFKDGILGITVDLLPLDKSAGILFPAGVPTGSVIHLEYVQFLKYIFGLDEILKMCYESFADRLEHGIDYSTLVTIDLRIGYETPEYKYNEDWTFVIDETKTRLFFEGGKNLDRYIDMVCRGIVGQVADEAMRTGRAVKFNHIDLTFYPSYYY